MVQFKLVSITHLSLWFFLGQWFHLTLLFFFPWLGQPPCSSFLSMVELQKDLSTWTILPQYSIFFRLQSFTLAFLLSFLIHSYSLNSHSLFHVLFLFPIHILSRSKVDQFSTIGTYSVLLTILDSVNFNPTIDNSLSYHSYQFRFTL